MERSEKALKRLSEGTVIPALPLALNDKRKLDECHQRALLRYYLAAGAGGIAAAVHTTQFEIRGPQVGLFQPILQITAEEIDHFEKESGRITVKIAGACGGTAQAVLEAETAKKCGFDAVLLSPGGLSGLSEDEMLLRTREVAKVLPVIAFYLQPSVGGRVFSFGYWQKICEIHNVVAIKCAPFNRYQTLEVVRAAALSDRADEITLYTGNDDNIVIDLLTAYCFDKDGRCFEKRFVGGLLGHWAVWTKKAVELFGEIKKAAEKDEIPAELLIRANEITDANAAFFDAANGFKGCIAGIHEVLRRQGLLDGIWCLNEKETLSLGQKEEIDRVCRMYPHLSDDAFVSENLNNWLR